MLGSDMHCRLTCTQLKAIVNSTQGDTNRNPTSSTGFGEDPFKLLIVITIESHPRTQVLRHLKGIDTITLHTVGTQSLELPFLVQETESVAIGKTRHTCYIKRVPTNLLHRSHKRSHCLRAVEGGDVLLTTIQKV